MGVDQIGRAHGLAAGQPAQIGTPPARDPLDHLTAGPLTVKRRRIDQGAGTGSPLVVARSTTASGEDQHGGKGQTVSHEVFLVQRVRNLPVPGAKGKVVECSIKMGLLSPAAAADGPQGPR